MAALQSAISRPEATPAEITAGRAVQAAFLNPELMGAEVIGALKEVGPLQGVGHQAAEALFQITNHMPRRSAEATNADIPNSLASLFDGLNRIVAADFPIQGISVLASNGFRASDSRPRLLPSQAGASSLGTTIPLATSILGPAVNPFSSPFSLGMTFDGSKLAGVNLTELRSTTGGKFGLRRQRGEVRPLEYLALIFGILAVSNIWIWVGPAGAAFTAAFVFAAFIALEFLRTQWTLSKIFRAEKDRRPDRIATSLKSWIGAQRREALAALSRLGPGALPVKHSVVALLSDRRLAQEALRVLIAMDLAGSVALKNLARIERGETAEPMIQIEDGAVPSLAPIAAEVLAGPWSAAAKDWAVALLERAPEAARRKLPVLMAQWVQLYADRRTLAPFVRRIGLNPEGAMALLIEAGRKSLFSHADFVDYHREILHLLAAHDFRGWKRDDLRALAGPALGQWSRGSGPGPQDWRRFLETLARADSPPSSLPAAVVLARWLRDSGRPSVDADFTYRLALRGDSPDRLPLLRWAATQTELDGDLVSVLGDIATGDKNDESAWLAMKILLTGLPQSGHSLADDLKAAQEILQKTGRPLRGSTAQVALESGAALLNTDRPGGLVILGAKYYPGRGVYGKVTSEATPDPHALADQAPNYLSGGPWSHGEFQIGVGFDTGELPPYRDRVKFASLALWATWTRRNGFRPLMNRPKRDPGASYGPVIRGGEGQFSDTSVVREKRRLDFLFQMAGPITKADLEALMALTKSLNLGLYMAVTYRSLGRHLGWTDRRVPVSHALTVARYELFERDLVNKLRQFQAVVHAEEVGQLPGQAEENQRRDYVSREAAARGSTRDIPGPNSEITEIREALGRFHSEDALHPDTIWVHDVDAWDVGSLPGWNELLARLRAVEGLMLQRGLDENSVGRRFLKEAEALAVEAADDIKTIADNPKKYSGEAPLVEERDPFLDPRQPEASRRYAEKVVGLIDTGQLRPADLPNAAEVYEYLGRTPPDSGPEGPHQDPPPNPSGDGASFPPTK